MKGSSGNVLFVGYASYHTLAILEYDRSHAGNKKCFCDRYGVNVGGIGICNRLSTGLET